MARKAVFLDRDGVINRYVCDPEFGTIDSPAHPDEFELLPNVAEAVLHLNKQGFLAVVVSNQPGIAKGRFTPSLLEATTQKMTALIQQGGARLDGIYYCLHHPTASVDGYRHVCDCRKPRAGLFRQAAKELDIDLAGSYTVGDGVVDILAGREAGTRTLFVGARKCYVCSELDEKSATPDWAVETLLEAAERIEMAEKKGTSSPLSNQPSESPCLWKKETAGYTGVYLQEAIEILKRIDPAAIERTAEQLADLRARGGRLFFIGVGGGAGHSSHAVCDFRKIARIEAYTPSDNVSELTARVNDDGWDTSYANWLRGSRLSSNDAIFVFSVGGGDVERNISANLVRALECAKQAGAKIFGVVGRDGGFTAKVADACVLVPVVNSATVTAHTEAFQALVWHLLVSHPRLKAAEMKWESTR